MRAAEVLLAVRAAARQYEEGLPLAKRKKLGQFFTGLPLGKLLAHLALEDHTRTVVDPMAGHGDLLDAVWEAALARGIRIDRLDGIDIDPNTAEFCRDRLTKIIGKRNHAKGEIIEGDAFNPSSVQALPCSKYDLVITNPPYVRYQSRSAKGSEDRIRAGLKTIVGSGSPVREESAWLALIDGYSGLADLSVPGWLLAASLVRAGGRLAIVVPATWRTRDYGDVLRYLLLRFFEIEYVVEDAQPGWFSDALVRTNLVIARRRNAEDILVPLKSRTQWPTAFWLQMASETAGNGSLVGRVFDGAVPEAEFSAWVQNGCGLQKPGIKARPFALKEDWDFLVARSQKRRWYRQLEGCVSELPLFASSRSNVSLMIPDVLRDVLPSGFSIEGLSSLEDAGVGVGQGLRTGCNDFFYVSKCEFGNAKDILVEASSFFDRRRFVVPADAVRPVLRRQSELDAFEKGIMPQGRVLDLRRWVLPEDGKAVISATEMYALCNEAPPRNMPEELAAFVRRASVSAAKGELAAKTIPELSAVRTKVRQARMGRVPPRFWYMLPEFAPRHLPAAFVPRINNGVAWVEANFDPAIVIDANFSTLWVMREGWSGYALKALINSAWCRAFMEALGTPFGGGALKLEATHLRHLPIPCLSPLDKNKLDIEGRQLTRGSIDVQSRIDAIVFKAVMSSPVSWRLSLKLAEAMMERAGTMSRARQRAA